VKDLTTIVRGRIAALIFDVDGTLADTELDGHRVAFNQAFQAAGFGWQWSVERYGQLLETAGGKERLQRYIHEDQPEFLATFASPVEVQAWAATLHKAKTQHYRTLMQTGTIPLRPGVKRLIQEARTAGVRLAIATTSAPENVIALLETTLAPDSPTWFEVIAAGDMVPAKKPAPDVYQYVLQALGLPGDRCLALEDSHQGLQAALAAGIPTVITRSSYTQQDDFTGASLVLDHLGEPHQSTCFTLDWAERLL
jgi:HAD superfamily hydrolase (TIGR01509 family)